MQKSGAKHSNKHNKQNLKGPDAKMGVVDPPPGRICPKPRKKKLQTGTHSSRRIRENLGRGKVRVLSKEDTYQREGMS